MKPVSITFGSYEPRRRMAPSISSDRMPYDRTAGGRGNIVFKRMWKLILNTPPLLAETYRTNSSLIASKPDGNEVNLAILAILKT